ncbi:unnamed protein product, partial [Closterium sp. NIES-53]
PLPGTVPVEVIGDSGGARGTASWGAKRGGAESEGAGFGGTESGGEEPGGAEPGGPAGASPRLSPRPETLSPQKLREWFVRHARLRSGATGARGAGAGGAGAGGAGAVDPGATVQSHPYFVSLLKQVLGVPSSTSLTPPLMCPPPDQSQLPLQPASPLSAPSPYTEKSSSLTERREPTSRPVSPVRTARRVPCSRPPPVPSTHAMALRPTSVPLRVPLHAPLESSLPEVPDPESDRARTTSPTVSRLLVPLSSSPVDATLRFAFGLLSVCPLCRNPSVHSIFRFRHIQAYCDYNKSTATSALVAQLLDFASACRLDYASALAADSASTSPPSVGGECALGTDVLEDRQEIFECLAAAVPCFASMLLTPEGDPDAPDIPTPHSYAEAITGPYSSQWQVAMDAEMASWISTGTYIVVVPPSRANIVDGMWIFRVKRPSGSRLAFKRDYELHSLDFSTNFLQGSLHEEIWVRRPPSFTRSFPDYTCGSSDPSLFLRTNTSLPPFYIPVYVDDLVFATADTEALTLVKSELQKRHTCTDLGPSALRLLVLLATAHSSNYRPLALFSTFRRVHRAEWSVPRACGLPHYVGHRARAWRTGSSCPHWSHRHFLGATLAHLPVDRLVRAASLPPFLYVDNKAMIALCQEHRLEHRMKHIALQYFLARELQLRGRLRVAYVATRANTADVFTKALPPGDHQHFSTVLGLVPSLPHLLNA